MTDHERQSRDAAAALAELLAGNRRFAGGGAKHPRADRQRHRDLRGGQRPLAVVLGCADSRVPPELIFDQGLGDLFVVRNAGNLADEPTLASIEYAAAHLATPLVLVLGHSDCGAVKAALAEDAAPGRCADLAGILRPLVDQARAELHGVTSLPAGDPPAAVPAPPGAAELVDRAARLNAQRVAAALRDCEPVLAPRVREGALSIHAAFYALESGLVELLD
ncbi:MAG: carbonic anhydrase [Candidatus Krumholzibacteriota bacterium]|nr:carbonic anhydrase [Candidatus Krumholzibacteriota bacterium]